MTKIIKNSGPNKLINTKSAEQKHLMETVNIKIQELNNEINSIIESQKQGYKLLMNLTSIMKEYQTTIGNLLSKTDLENVSKFVRNTSPKKLIETKGKEQQEFIQSMSKKI
jgi:hypothetical protein